MKKRAVIVLADGYEDVEATAPIDVLRRAGVEVTVAGLDRKVILSSHRVTVVADAVFSAVKDEEWDAIILPGGGKGSRNLSESYDVVSTAVRLCASGKLVAAICAAPAVVLGGSGILEGKRVTCYPGMESACPSISFDHTKGVITDGNLITAQGVGYALAFALAIATHLVGKDVSDKVAGDILYQRG